MKRKYKKGLLIIELSRLVDEILAGRCVYLNHKPQNPAWLMNMNLHTLNSFVKSHRVWQAVENI